MPIDRHSSSHRSFRVPLVESKYSLGMAFNIAFGNWTCRYSHSSSEYLNRKILKSVRGWSQCAGQSGTERVSRDAPRRVVNGLEKLLQTCALIVSQRSGRGVATRRVDAHVVVGSRHCGSGGAKFKRVGGLGLLVDLGLVMRGLSKESLQE